MLSVGFLSSPYKCHPSSTPPPHQWQLLLATAAEFSSKLFQFIESASPYHHPYPETPLHASQHTLSSTESGSQSFPNADTITKHASLLRSLASPPWGSSFKLLGFNNYNFFPLFLSPKGDTCLPLSQYLSIFFLPF